MVAITVISIVFTAVFRLYSQTVSMNMAVRFYTKAPLVAEKMLTRAVSGMYEDVTSGLSADQHIDRIEGYPGYTCIIQYTPVRWRDQDDADRESGSRLVEIILNIENKEGRRQFQVTTHRFFYEKRKR